MGTIPDRDKNIFSDAEKSMSRGFTEEELIRVHELALELGSILKSMVSREYPDDTLQSRRKGSLFGVKQDRSS